MLRRATSPYGRGEASTRLAPLTEEVLQQRGGLALVDAAIDVRPVMAGRRREEADAVLDRPALLVGGAEIEPPDAGKRHRRRTHRARLQRHIEIAVGEP